ASEPTTNPLRGSMNIMCLKFDVVPFPDGIHVSPPSLVIKIVPLSPQTIYLPASTMSIDLRSAVTLDSFCDHELPPSVVFKITPPSPSTIKSVSLICAELTSLLEIPLVRSCQLWPISVVF